MATRIVEWKRPYTWWKAITVDENRVISLNLRWENNLIIWDEWDNEIYVDLQLPDWRTPQSTFPVWITTGRVASEDGWDVTGTIISAKTTSWDNIQILYGDNWTLWIDNGSWTFKQIYFKWDVDTIVALLQNQIDVLSGLGKFLSLWDCVNGEPMSFPLETPYEYSTWDYYLIGNVSSATPPVNYRPAWDEWIDNDPSTKETESATVERWDTYIYDWTVWLLQKNTATGWTGTWDVIWPVSATDWHLAVFDWATWKIIKDGWAIPSSNTKTFYLSGSSDTTTAQEAYDWYADGNNPIIVFWWNEYLFYSYDGTNMIFRNMSDFSDTNTYTKITRYRITFVISSWTVTSIINASVENRFLRTGKNYSSPYNPDYDGSPATKKYVDDIKPISWNGVPSSTPDFIWQLYVDTTNSKLYTATGTSSSSDWSEAWWWWGDVVVSPDANNTLTTWAWLRAWLETDYQNISTPDSNTLYFTF